LHRHWEKLREALRLEKMSAAARHKIRIRGKRLRYASEFFGDLYLGGPSRKAYKLFVQRLTRLQDDLGELNDIETGKRLMARLNKDAPQPDPSDVPPSMAPGATVRYRTEAEILEDAVVSFERLKETPAFWEPDATNQSGDH
jgi:CHAD domain-containing protein